MLKNVAFPLNKLTTYCSTEVTVFLIFKLLRFSLPVDCYQTHYKFDLLFLKTQYLPIDKDGVIGVKRLQKVVKQIRRFEKLFWEGDFR